MTKDTQIIDTNIWWVIVHVTTTLVFIEKRSHVPVLMVCI